jgi:hypothetical protein
MFDCNGTPLISTSCIVFSTMFSSYSWYSKDVLEITYGRNLPRNPVLAPPHQKLAKPRALKGLKINVSFRSRCCIVQVYDNFLLL